jgi:hypothetical protein
LHGRSDSNARHLVLETSALPTELHPYLGDLLLFLIGAGLATPATHLIKMEAEFFSGSASL